MIPAVTTTDDLEVIDALTVLQHNFGFRDQDLQRWIPYAIAKQFRPQSAIRVIGCPDCGRQPVLGLGRFETFSTLVQLQECSCGLIWANARVDAPTTAWHFETHAYYDETYYATCRAAVFAQLAELIDARTPYMGRVLDIGGAGGQFASVLRERRPDLQITVQDVSATKVQQAILRGFGGIFGKAWMDAEEPFDTILLSDAIYYEPNLTELWGALARLKRGAIILRVPNRVWRVKLSTWQQSVTTALPVKLQGHNPDHLVIGSQAYYMRRLREVGCTQVSTMPTPIGEGRSIPGLYGLAKAVYAVTGICVTPSMVIIGE